MASYDDYNRDPLTRDPRSDAPFSTNVFWGVGLAAAVVVLLAVLFGTSHGVNPTSQNGVSPAAPPPIAAPATPSTAPVVPNPNPN